MFIEKEFFSEGATLKGRWYGAENGPKGHALRCATDLCHNHDVFV
jgi:hypothetical protein